jgi:hypothetical protein
MSVVLVLAHGGEFCRSRMIVSCVVMTCVIVIVMPMGRVIVASMVMI